MNDNTFRPILFVLQDENDRCRYDDLVKSEPNILIFDNIQSQLRELVKVENPSKNPTEQEFEQLIADHLHGRDIGSYGVWAYYPWSKRLIHVLPEDEFIAVRTNRNQNKVTATEQKTLQSKCAGIIGLSVGQSIALTMAMERTCGTLKLADFDLVELSNLNRIRTGLHNLEVSKVFIAAREIAEIDPFIQVEIFEEGLTDDNMNDFFDGAQKLDLLVEVCDSLDVKLKCRIEARKRQIPVVMETNDRCMLDIERFDIEPERAILHGLVNDEDIAAVGQLNGRQRMELVLKIVDGQNLSASMKSSFAEVGKTLRSWPQLASSVTLGAGVTTDVVRRLLLNEDIKSGRRYFDIEQILPQYVLY